MKPAKLRTDKEEAKAMMHYVSLFDTLENATAFQDAALKTATTHLPPCAITVRNGGAPSAVFWRWLAAMAEAWS